MFRNHAPPKEGDIYKTVKIDSHTFELRYGYYEDFEREAGEPVVIYPKLTQLYSNEGYPIVTAVQEPCSHYEVPDGKPREECCVDCIYYTPPGEDLGICRCEKLRRKPG